MRAPRSHTLGRCEAENAFTSPFDKRLNEQRNTLSPLSGCSLQFLRVCAYPFPAVLHTPLPDGNTFSSLQNNWKRLFSGEGQNIISISGDHCLRDVEAGLSGLLKLTALV